MICVFALPLCDVINASDSIQQSKNGRTLLSGLRTGSPVATQNHWQCERKSATTREQSEARDARAEARDIQAESRAEREETRARRAESRAVDAEMQASSRFMALLSMMILLTAFG